MSGVTSLRESPTAKPDVVVMIVGLVAANLGVLVTLAGFVAAFAMDNPIAGESLLVWGFWVSGLGVAAFLYASTFDIPAGDPPPRRWYVAIIALLLTPCWGAISVPVAAIVYPVLTAYGLFWAFGVVRGWLCGRHRPVC
jgi:hypothetical protein